MKGSAVISRLAAVLFLAIFVAGCQPDELGYGAKHKRPLSAETRGRINDLGMSLYSPILIRIFKEENTLEVWKRKRTGRFALLKSYEICKWSGKLGPKFKEGDRQAPEGFYAIYPAQMNPNSNYHLSFNLGFPNPYDRAHGRTGSHLMVHGACSSRGCYAMEDAQIQEIYSLARDSFKGGQRAFQVQAFPFRMTPENMARHTGNTHMPFWEMLKVGHDHFEITKTPPKVDYCGRRYVFNAASENENLRFNARAACPSYTVPEQLATAVASKQEQDASETKRIIARLEEKRQREEAWKKRERMIAEALGAKKRPSEDAVAGEGASKVAAIPAPKPGSPAALALAEERKSGAGSFFSAIFGGDEKPKQDPVEPIETATGDDASKPKPVAEAPPPPADIPDADAPAETTDVQPESKSEKKSGSVFTRWLGIGESAPEPVANAPEAEQPQS